MAWIGGRPEAPPQPTIEQMMRGGPEKGVAVSADTLRAQRRVDEVTGGSVETPWVADSSEEEDGWEAYVENGVITQEAPGLGDAHAGTPPATPVRDATPAVVTAANAATGAATAAATATVTAADASTAAAAAGVKSCCYCNHCVASVRCAPVLCASASSELGSSTEGMDGCR